MAKATEVSATYDQPSSAPTNKMTAVGISGAVTVLVLAVVEAFTQVQVSSEVASALTIVVAFLFGYFTKEKAYLGN